MAEAQLFDRLRAGLSAIEMRLFAREVLRCLAVAPGEQVLEVGFGDGLILERATRRHPEAQFAGLAHTEDKANGLSLRSARLIESSRLELSIGDSSKLPWLTASFDAIFAVRKMSFSCRTENDICEMARVLRPGGRVILGFRERRSNAEGLSPSEISQFSSRDEVRALLGAAGMAATFVAWPLVDLWIVKGSFPRTLR